MGLIATVVGTLLLPALGLSHVVPLSAINIGVTKNIGVIKVVRTKRVVVIPTGLWSGVSRRGRAERTVRGARAHSRPGECPTTRAG